MHGLSSERMQKGLAFVEFLRPESFEFSVVEGLKTFSPIDPSHVRGCLIEFFKRHFDQDVAIILLLVVRRVLTIRPKLTRHLEPNSIVFFRARKWSQKSFDVVEFLQIRQSPDYHIVRLEKGSRVVLRRMLLEAHARICISLRVVATCSPSKFGSRLPVISLLYQPPV